MEKLKDVVLTSEGLCAFVCDNYLKVGEVEYRLTDITEEHIDSGRHTETYTSVKYLEETDQYFRVSYRTSCKDSMDWKDCNSSDNNVLLEVFPMEVTKTIYTSRKE